MPKVTDIRGMPGDIVLVRGIAPIDVWTGPGQSPMHKVGTVSQKSSGLIISVAENHAWTYVLWSNPCIMGYVLDGQLRKVKIES